MDIKHIENKHYELSAEAIDAVAADIMSICAALGAERKSIMRLRLSVEESLSVWLEHLGEGAAVTLCLSTKLFRPHLSVRVKGKRVNPYEVQDEDYKRSRDLLMSIGLIPGYQYSSGCNELSFLVKKKPMNQLLKFALIFTAALFIGILGKALIPAEALSYLVINILEILQGTILRILTCLAGPMIFLAVAWGIYCIGDVYTFGKIGKKMLARYVLATFIFAAAGCIAYPIIGQALSAGSEQAIDVGSLLKLFTDIVPGNIFSPFTEGNTLQIILLATIMGIALIFLGKKARSVARAVEQTNNVIRFLMTFIAKVVPFLVIIVVVKLIWSGEYTLLGRSWQFAVGYFGLYLLTIVAFIAIVAKRTRTPAMRLVKYCMPSYLIAITTASSAAAFDSNITICNTKFGISPAVTSFGIPLGMVTYKPISAIFAVLLCFYFSTAYNIPVSVGWIVIAVLLSAISAISLPPIPGGTAAAYTLLFAQLGIPLEAVAISVAMDLIFDFLCTGGNMLCLLLQMFSISKGDKDSPKEKPAAV